MSMKNVFLIAAALLFSQEAVAWKMPRTTAECLQQPMQWLEDPGYGNPLDEKRIMAACSASSQTEPDAQGKDGSICATTIARVQNGYNEVLRKKQEACLLVDRFMPASGCHEGASQLDQRKCFMAAMQSDENAKNQVRELIHSLNTQKKTVLESIPTLADAAKNLAEIGRNLTEEAQTVGSGHTGDYSPEAKRNAAKVGATRPSEGAQKVNPGLRMSATDFERYKKFIDQLVGSDVTGDHRQAIESIRSPQLRQQAMALYQAKRFTQGVQYEAQQQQAISQSLTQNQLALGDAATDLSTLGSDNGLNMNQALQGTALANQAAALQQGGGGGVKGGAMTGISPALKDIADIAEASSPSAKQKKEGRTDFADLLSSNAESSDPTKAALLDTSEAGGTSSLKADLEDRKGLRDKLKGRSLRSGASRMPASGGAGEAPALDANGQPILDKNGNPLTRAELERMIESGDKEALASFSGPNFGGGLSLAGSETDEMVEFLVDEMQDALGLNLGTSASSSGEPGLSMLTPSEAQQIQSAREILAADSQGLFERIHVLYQRCQQKGCVLGKQASPL